MSGNVANMQNETQDLQQRVANLQNELNLSMGENERLIEELGRQQALYTELKKMRGRGEEMDMLQQLEQVSKIGEKIQVNPLVTEGGGRGTDRLPGMEETWSGGSPCV